MKKIMLLGGSGALGSYLVPELLKAGHRVHVVSLDDCVSNDPSLTFEKANAKDDAWLEARLKDDYDAIVDFMIYATKEFAPRAKLLMSTGSYTP